MPDERVEKARTPKEIAESMITDDDLLNEARAALVAEWLLKKWDGDISLVEEEVSDFDDRCLNVVFSRDGVVDKVLSEIGCKPGQVQTEDERVERERATLHPTVLSVLKKYGDDPRNLVKAYRVIGRVVDFMKRNYIDTANELKNVYAELGKEIKKMAVRGKVESE